MYPLPHSYEVKQTRWKLKVLLFDKNDRFGGSAPGDQRQLQIVLENVGGEYPETKEKVHLKPFWIFGE